MLEGENSSIPENGGRKISNFFNAIDSFPEEERESAKKYAAVVSEYAELAHGDDVQFDKCQEIHSIIKEFCHRMFEKYGKDAVCQVKLYHLVAGSSLDGDEWLMYGLDLPNGEFAKFISETLAPMVG